VLIVLDRDGVCDTPMADDTRCQGPRGLRDPVLFDPMHVAFGILQAGIRGGPQGDLYVVIHIQEHEIFQREEDNLYCEVPIPFTLAALGGEVPVPTLDGKAQVKVPAGTQSGQVFKLRGKGIVHVNGRERGDLLARLIVEVPTRLNADQQQKLEEFASSCGEENTPIRKSFFDRAKEFFR